MKTSACIIRKRSITPTMKKSILLHNKLYDIFYPGLAQILLREGLVHVKLLKIDSKLLPWFISALANSVLIVFGTCVFMKDIHPATGNSMPLNVNCTAFHIGYALFVMFCLLCELFVYLGWILFPQIFHVFTELQQLEIKCCNYKY